MVIDMHNHIWTRESLPESWWQMYATFFSTYITDSAFSGTPLVADFSAFQHEAAQNPAASAICSEDAWTASGPIAFYSAAMAWSGH